MRLPSHITIQRVFGDNPYAFIADATRIREGKPLTPFNAIAAAELLNAYGKELQRLAASEPPDPTVTIPVLPLDPTGARTAIDMLNHQGYHQAAKVLEVAGKAILEREGAA